MVLYAICAVLTSPTPKLEGINEDGGVGIMGIDGGGGSTTGTGKKPVSLVAIGGGGDGGNMATYAIAGTLLVLSVFTARLTGVYNDCAQYLRSLDAHVCTLRAHSSNALCY